MKKYLRFVLALGLLSTSGLPLARASDVAAKLAFAAMNHPNPELVGAVQLMVQTGFLLEVEQIVRSHQGTSDHGPIETASKIRELARHSLVHEHMVEIPQVGLVSPDMARVTHIEWLPGAPVAAVEATFYARKVGGNHRWHFTASLTVQVATMTVSTVEYAPRK